MNNQDSNAASSTAVEAPPQHIEVEDFTHEQRENWLKTGDLPEKPKPVADESGASKPARKGKEAESGTAKESDEERNWKNLRETNKREKERADRLEAEIAELRKAPKQVTDEKKVAESSTAQPVGLPKEPERPKRPRLAEFGTHDAYESAMDKYDEAMLAFPEQRRAFYDAKSAFEKDQAASQARNQKTHDAWKGIFEKGRELYDEWNANGFASDLPIMQHDPIEMYLRDSETAVAAHMLQHLAKNRKELERIVGLSSREQFREMQAIEETLREELHLGGAPTAKQRSEEKPKTELTRAGKPPSEVGGRAATSDDEAEAALKRGDGDTYRKIVNEREMVKLRAKRKGR